MHRTSATETGAAILPSYGMEATTANGRPRSTWRNAMEIREQVIEALYEGITHDAELVRALGLVRRYLNAAGMGLGVQDMVSHSFWAVAEDGIDMTHNNIYLQHASKNHVWQTIGKTGRPMTDLMVMP